MLRAYLSGLIGITIYALMGCNAGGYLVSPGDGFCLRDTDCPEEQSCVQGSCVQLCPGGSSCPELHVCLNGICKLATCGDGKVDQESLEVCDDGRNDGIYGCSIDCKQHAPSYCGDKRIDKEHGEVCDDGRNDGIYGCNPDCRSLAPAYCGDGVVNKEFHEVCDDGRNDGIYGCNPDCLGFAPNYCGDNIVDIELGEDCDNGKENNTGGYNKCTSTCKFPETRCGDGLVQANKGETCDDGINNGVYGCSVDCKTKAPAYCGDGLVNSIYLETCDDGVNNGVYGCSTDCKHHAPAYCGDGLIDYEHNETCDDGQTLNVGGYNKCLPNCTLNPERCGDKVIQAAAGEICDDGVNDGIYGCTRNCQAYAPKYCGNGITETEFNEFCDDGVHNGEVGCCQIGCGGIDNTAVYVSGIGSDNANCGGRINPCRSLTFALNKAVCGKIKVLAGTYNTSAGENFPLTLPPKSILLGDPENLGALPTAEILIKGYGNLSTDLICGSVQKAALIINKEVKIIGLSFDVPWNNPATFAIVGRKNPSDLEPFKVQISNNTFKNGKGGICLKSAKNALIDHNYFATSEWGIYATGDNTAIEIKNNEFMILEGVDISILNPTNTSYIHDNIFRGGDYIFDGVEVQQGSPLIENNLFYGKNGATPGEYTGFTESAILVSYDGEICKPVIRKNKFIWNNEQAVALTVGSAPANSVNLQVDVGTSTDAGANDFSTMNGIAIKNLTTDLAILALGNSWPHNPPTCSGPLAVPPSSGPAADLLLTGASGSITYGSHPVERCPANP